MGDLNRYPLYDQGSAERRFEDCTFRHRSGFPQIAHSTPVVFIVDNDTPLRESLELLIRSAGWQPMAFGSAEEFLDCPRDLAPNCLVLELLLPGLDGLDLQKLATKECPHMPVIFITDHGDVSSTVRAMKAGAVEFLTKPLNNKVLLSAIEQALQCSQSSLQRLTGIQTLLTRYSSLSNREREVMALVVSGRLNKQVAADLGISEVTVKAHRGRVMHKMEADSLADLVMMAGKLGVAQLRM